MDTTKQTEEKQLFIYPQKINQLDPVFYNITVEDVEVEGSFEGVESEFILERNGVKIPLKEVLNKLLATSRLAKEFIGLFERDEKMRLQQKAYFDRRLNSDLKASKKLEGTNDSYLEVCRPTYKTLKKFNQE